jgi:MFS family permease
MTQRPIPSSAWSWPDCDCYRAAQGRAGYDDRQRRAAALHFSNSDLEWVVNAYALASGALRLLGGRSGGLQGRRRVFIADIVLFSLGSLAGLGPDQAWLRLGPTIVTSIGMGLVFVSMSLVALARVGNNDFDVTSILLNAVQ